MAFPEYYNLKHPKPIEQSPSKVFAAQVAQWKAPMDKPVVDVACGYGRNGAYLVDLGYDVVFVDRDKDALEYIKQGIGVSICSETISDKRYSVMEMDLLKEQWPFEKGTLAGIIEVDFYAKKLLPRFCDSLISGGFLYIETIHLRGNNYLGLPFENEVEEFLNQCFTVQYYRAHKKIIPNYSKTPVESLTVFAVKNGN